MRVPKKRDVNIFSSILMILVLASNTFIFFNPNTCLWGDVIYKARTGVRNYEFDGTISREVLESYLSRSITYSSLLDRSFLEGWAGGDLNDSIRCITNVGAKFIGRVVFTWNGENRLLNYINDSRQITARIHAIDSEIILQACFFETVSIKVESIPVPAWVFEEFGLIPEVRNFSFNDMYVVGGPHEDFWGNDTAVPDMSKLETRMWAFYLSAVYIDIGIEAIHFGQVALMSTNDPDHANWRDMLQRVRAYATTHARRHLVICDAHVPNGGYVHDCKLMFDFHSFPIRSAEIEDEPQKTKLVAYFLDSIYKRSKGGITPSGWACDSLPYIVEFDNAGLSDTPGEYTPGMDTWGYDDILWYAHQPEQYRNSWLWYGVRWLESNDPNGFLQMPGSRPLAEQVNGSNFYFANTESVNMTNGFNQEETIKTIWEQMPHYYLV
jgi:hypothetical protein